MSKPRYAVGIDLGTTHTALAYALVPEDGTSGAPPVEVLGVPQLVAQGTVEARELLPSFFYVAHESDGPQSLPWDTSRTYVVGEHARARGVDAPARVITSAKSWLGHPTVDRRGAILPPGAPEDVERISPVEASWRYLEHLVEAWDHVVAKGDPELALNKQSVVLTVPASFDAAARELTTEAAFAAGLEDLTLLEEPQAAFYAWLASRGDAWRKDVKVGDAVLVVDVGGGTTDFSVIAAVEKDGELALERVAVGEHILLGGDNMDLLLAHIVEQKMVADAEAAGRTLELDRWQKISLQHAARGAKEKLLGDSKAKSAPIAIAGKGSKLVGSTLRAEVTREEVTRAIIDGFFPIVDAEARPQTRARAALTTLGLPYAQDAAVTKHLAALLARHADALERVGAARSGDKKTTAKMLHPPRILFNGGVMKSAVLRERVLACLGSWLEDAGAPPPVVLEGTDLDLAVARGAAAYALARQGRGVRIRGGTGRAYYVGIEGAVPAIPGLEPPVTALCVAPFGMEEGTSADVPGPELGVVVGEKVRFRFFGSNVRRQDGVGAALERWKKDELDELAPIEVDLPAEGRSEGDVVPVRLHSSITEVGTLLLEAVPLAPNKPDERWKVELSVRSE